ncbi:ParB/RepB/Spo0J family partition protein [Nocardia neocaledoniensis]|uniref:ParB/RepB/Spo0J family partition protein n=1 Tax=Nocardia neocaledoniensis TaxID=236511 RepID=UPI00245375A9|nr:ParB N-terminal domain-containing protein [Nocardia neocaledoniensis]
MAGRGGRANLADLVGSTGKNSTVDGVNARASSPAKGPTPEVVVNGAPLEIKLEDLVANPLNPREIMDVDDLASIIEIQLQPALIIGREAYLKLWPELESELGDAKYVVINGCRRLEAARKFGRTTLECVRKDEVADSRASLRAASIRENVERENLDVIEEAKAVEALVSDCEGNGARAGQILGKTKMWVSQRRALLKLTPELQAKLRAGELAIREARELGRVPAEEQVARWKAQLEKKEREQAGETSESNTSRRDVDTVKIVKTLKKWDADTTVLASALFVHLDRGGVHELIEQLNQMATSKEDE